MWVGGGWLPRGWGTCHLGGWGTGGAPRGDAVARAHKGPTTPHSPPIPKPPACPQTSPPAMGPLLEACEGVWLH